MFDRLHSNLRREWLRHGRGLKGLDPRASIHFSVDITVSHPNRLRIGPGARVDRRCWLNVPVEADDTFASLDIGAGSKIGRGTVISARNLVQIGRDCVTGPNVLITDHAHEFRDPAIPIVAQGVTAGGRVIIEPGCWIGFGAVVIGNAGELRIGRNSVIGANSVVTRNVDPMTVVAGVPARVVRRFDEQSGEWRAALL